MPNQPSHSLSTSASQLRGLSSLVHELAETFKRSHGQALEKPAQDNLDRLSNAALKMQGVALSLEQTAEATETQVYGAPEAGAITPGVPTPEDVKQDEKEKQAMEDTEQEHKEASDAAIEKTSADAKAAQEKPAKARKTRKAKAAK
jgi:hypothetical protein